MYGYDIMIDENLRCWLIEVNASPSLVGTTRNDFAFKKTLVNDMLNVVIPKEWSDQKTGNIASSCKDKLVGDFELIYNESKDVMCENLIKAKGNIRRGNFSRNFY